MQLLLIALMAVGVAAVLLWIALPSLIARSIRPVDPVALGFRGTGDDLLLAERVGEAFRAGIRARMLCPRSAWLAKCDALQPHWRPFAFEGAAFGHGALASCGFLRWDRLEADVIARRRQYVYLAYVGAGFWWAFRHGRRFEKMLPILRGYDPLYRYLCADGYGFKFGFFDFMRDRSRVAHLVDLPGYYRNAAFQGVGRGLYFGFLGDRGGLFEAVGDFAPEHDADLIAGAGLAAAFAETDRPYRAVDFARAVPFEWRPHAHLGLTFGFKARALAEPDYFDDCLSKLRPPAAAAIRRAVVLCDEVERAVRGDGAKDGYRRWREHLTDTMESERVWEPVYACAQEDSRDRKGVVGHWTGEEP